MTDYSSERYDPALASCGLIQLSFDGKKLTMKAGTKEYTYHAVSGKPQADGSFDYSGDAQKKPFQGPIPEGVYWIRPDELWENAWYKNGQRSAWGNFRITIHPFTTTKTHGRGGFFIHGGERAGSAGCIDLWSDVDRFIKDLKAELGGNSECQIHVHVRY
ncbi:MAG TPA: tlde1 domain-containing protein [Myxococcaceae bacterium]|nr:tlde1 domain-containing protein [Myxococcaceae bacterium]